MKKLYFLVMSVGPCEKNETCKYLNSIGARERIIVVLPNQFEKNAESYAKEDITTYIYDEQQYINQDFEYFGFKPRNCGGIGRQGIAEATEHFSDENILLCQVDDDTSGFSICGRDTSNTSGWKRTTIKNFDSLEQIMNLFERFYKQTGIKIQGRTGATLLGIDDIIWANRKIFNNFLMYPEDKLKFKGFAALCSDDVRYNIYKNLIEATPMLSVRHLVIGFAQNQGDRNDGNAVLYNKDCSWKKSFVLRMILPNYAKQYIAKETNRILFRETMKYSILYPPIMLEDANGNITSRLKMK